MNSLGPMDCSVGFSFCKQFEQIKENVYLCEQQTCVSDIKPIKIIVLWNRIKILSPPFSTPDSLFISLILNFNLR